MELKSSAFIQPAIKHLLMLNTLLLFALYTLGVAGIYLAIPQHRTQPGHACKWSECPYKGIKVAQYERAVSKYVGEACTDAYHIDMLHLQYPADEYEQLEDKLFKSVLNAHKTR